MPGAGKDTQIDLLNKVRPVELIKVGDLVRERSKTDTEIAKVLQQGGLVDNEIVDRIVSEKISSFEEGSIVVADGFPRDLPQAEWIESFAEKRELNIMKFIYLEIPDEESIKRLLKRGREDDGRATIENRIEVFHNRTNPVLKYFENKKYYKVVDGVGSVEEVHERIKRALAW
jgi:adenylate kinase